jgi:hypothetical protein
MNETDLMFAYRKVISEEEREEAIERIENRSGAVKCVIESCMTMIDLSARRAICRYHRGKEERGELARR